MQTLHSKHFDQGTRLLQTPFPGIEHDCRSVEELSQILARKGGNMLVDCIRNHLYLYGSFLAAPEDTADDSPIYKRHAPKLTAADRFIDWTTWTGAEIMRRHQVLGALWSLAKVDDDSQALRRIIWSVGFQRTYLRPRSELTVGQPTVIGDLSPSRMVFVKTCNGEFLTISRMKIEGGQEDEPLKSVIKAKMNDPKTLHADGPLLRTQILSTLPDHYRDPKASSPKTNYKIKTT